jgi:hypothetical protein
MEKSEKELTNYIESLNLNDEQLDKIILLLKKMLK